MGETRQESVYKDKNVYCIHAPPQKKEKVNWIWLYVEKALTAKSCPFNGIQQLTIPDMSIMT